MADELDLQILPPVAKVLLTISLGAAYKSVQAVTAPGETFAAVTGAAKQMVTVPAETEPGLRNSAEALAGVWMEKGMNLLDECKTAGQKFTGEQDGK